MLLENIDLLPSMIVAQSGEETDSLMSYYVGCSQKSVCGHCAELGSGSQLSADKLDSYFFLMSGRE